MRKIKNLSHKSTSRVPPPRHNFRIASHTPGTQVAPFLGGGQREMCDTSANYGDAIYSSGTIGGGHVRQRKRIWLASEPIPGRGTSRRIPRICVLRRPISIPFSGRYVRNVLAGRRFLGSEVNRELGYVLRAITRGGSGQVRGDNIEDRLLGRDSEVARSEAANRARSGRLSDPRFRRLFCHRSRVADGRGDRDRESLLIRPEWFV